MARRRYEWDEARIRKYEMQGRGHGEGRSYKPWLKDSDVPSRGRSHRVYWETTDRTHHFFSDHEYYAFLQQAWNPAVVDIREQFSLLRDKTVAIAKLLKIRHPTDSQSRTLLVMTTDLVVTRILNGVRVLTAIAVKSSADLNSKRTLEKLEI